MSMHERTGQRDLTYSRWHRSVSTARFLGALRAAALTAIDVDWCEVCCYCNEPLALIETQESRRGPKKAHITTKLGERAEIPVFSVAYVVSEDRTDITEFSVRQLWPITEVTPTALDPPSYAGWLESLRLPHYAQRSLNGQRCGPSSNAA